MRTGPEDAQARAEWRRARWNVARQHHPDVGGDPEVYHQMMRDVEHRFAPSRTTDMPQDASTARAAQLGRAVRRGRRRVRKGARRVRSVLPRRVPGSRRYFDL